MPRPRWTAGRGALVLIALLFAASALIRLGSGAGTAIAQEIASLQDASVTEPSGEDARSCTQPEEIDLLLASISEQQSKLRERQSQLDTFEQTLRFSEEKISERLAELEQAEERLASLLSLSETAAENDLARLTAVYENMKPTQAAKLFEQMVPEFAAGFVGRMRADAAAQIMAALPAETAYSISVILAGRNANAPTR